MRQNPHVRSVGGQGQQRPWSTRPRIGLAPTLEWEEAASAGRCDTATLPGTPRPIAGHLPRAGFGPKIRRLFRLLDPPRARSGRRPEIRGASARPAADARLRGRGAGRAVRGRAQRRGGGAPAGRPARRHAYLGTSADADQRRSAAVDSQHHRVAPAGHLQSEKTPVVWYPGHRCLDGTGHVERRCASMFRLVTVLQGLWAAASARRRHGDVATRRRTPGQVAGLPQHAGRPLLVPFGARGGGRPLRCVQLDVTFQDHDPRGFHQS